MLAEVTDLRIERRAPRASGLGGGWFFHCAFAGRTWPGRFYGRDWDFLGDGDEAAWKELSRVHRDAFRARIVAALQEAEIADYRRTNRQSKLALGMRIQLRLALRDRAMHPVARPAVVACRPAPPGARAQRPRRTRVAHGAGRLAYPTKATKILMM